MASILPQTHGKTLPDAWDFKGRPAQRASSGGWGAAAMILGGEAVERLTTLGIAVNLVTYLTGTMHLGNATSATTVTNFLGTSFMLCLLGGFVADSFLGRYLTIAIFATIQATGVTVLTISTAVPSLRPPKCAGDTGEVCVPASGMQLTVLHIALYLTALGTGGLKSSVSGFGSDQFDENDKEERRRMTSFFSWFFLLISIGSLLAVSVLVYIQDNVGRAYGYGICALAIVLGLVLFLAGTRRYRFKKLLGSPLTQIATVLVAAWRNRALDLPADSSKLYDLDDLAHGSKQKTKQRLPRSDQFRFMDKAAIKTAETSAQVGMVNKWSISTVTDIEEVKCVIRMLPIWVTTIMFWTIHAQVVTFSVSQSETMDRHMGSFEIPAASLAVFFVASTIITIPIYDRLVVPVGRKLLKSPQSMTRPLQRIGIGLVCSILGMVVAAMVETKRLHFATSSGLADDPKAVLSLPVFWLVPQFLIVGAGEAFMYIGQLDFFLRECPKGMKTMSTGLFLSTLSVGFFISSLLVTIVEKVTKKNPWLADNLNHGKLYDFYWLLAVMSALNFLVYSLCAKWYVYKEKRLADQGIEMEESLDIVGH